MRRVILGTTVMALAALALSGCITIQLPGGAGQGNNNKTPRDMDVSCRDAALTLNESNTSYVLTGDCDDVSIQGQNITVSADSIDTLDISGDGMLVTVEEFDELAISGQENTVKVGDGGDATLTGDRNTLASSDDLDSVTINGNENEISAGGFIADVHDNGNRNTTK